MLSADLKATGIPETTDNGKLVFHSLRHTSITNLVRIEPNIKVVQALARHADIKTALALYTHVVDADLRAAVERLP